MAETKTPNYDLVKPDPQDFYDVLKFNGNADKIDAALKALSDALGGIDLTTIQEQLTSHLADEMPHQFSDGTTKYKYGFKTNAAKDGLIFVYEEVV